MWWKQIYEQVKGWKYAAQPERLIIQNDGTLLFHGNHGFHVLTLSVEGWICDCQTFQHFTQLDGWCRHQLAAVHILTATDERTAMVCQAELVQWLHSEERTIHDYR